MSAAAAAAAATVGPLKQLNSWKHFGGLLRKFEHFSVSTQTNMRFNIYMPGGASKAQPVSTLYWLSGLTCTEDNFAQKAVRLQSQSQCSCTRARVVCRGRCWLTDCYLWCLHACMCAAWCVYRARSAPPPARTWPWCALTRARAGPVWTVRRRAVGTLASAPVSMSMRQSRSGPKTTECTIMSPKNCPKSCGITSPSTTNSPVRD
jgi:hypothetical protein